MRKLKTNYMSKFFTLTPLPFIVCKKCISNNKFSLIFTHHNIVLMPQDKYSIKNLSNSDMKRSHLTRKKNRNLSD